MLPCHAAMISKPKEVSNLIMSAVRVSRKVGETHPHFRLRSNQ